MSNLVLDKKITFFDPDKPLNEIQNDQFSYDVTNIVYQDADKTNTFQTKREKRNIKKKFNYIDFSVQPPQLKVNLFIGLNSEYLSNQVLNSNYYGKPNDDASDLVLLDDTNYFVNSDDTNARFPELQNRPLNSINYTQINNDRIFDDSNSNVNNVVFRRKIKELNKNRYQVVDYKKDTFKFVPTLGLENPNETFSAIKDEPFEDLDNIENVNEFLLMPNEIKYPRYFNSYALSRLNSNICVFGILDSIDGNFTTEKSLVGIKAEIITGSLDASKNEMLVKEREDDKINKIEPFLDEEDTDTVNISDNMLKRSFNYSTKIINNVVYSVLDTSLNANTTLYESLTNKIIFYTEDDTYKISPFSEKYTEASDDESTKVSFATGKSKNYNNSMSYDSIAFTGEID